MGNDRKMIDKDTADATFWGLVGAITLGVFGALVRLLQGWKGGKLTKQDYINAAIDLLGSLFISIVTWALCAYWLQLHPIASVGMAGVAGHIGTRATILAIRRYIGDKIK